jgi:hypothetical protein
MGYTHGYRACPGAHACMIALREKGLTNRAIANGMGIAKKHVEWCFASLRKSRRPRIRGSFWDDVANVLKLESLYRLGLPMSEIAHRMGITKNAVIGRCHRIGLVRRAGKAYRPAPNPFPEPGICLWPGDGEDIVFNCSERQHKYLDRTGQLVSSPYCKEHHKRAYWDVKLKIPGAPRESNVVKVA